MARAVANWTDEAGLDKLHREGWSERSRRDIPEEARTLIELHHPGGGKRHKRAVVTFRSLPLRGETDPEAAENGMGC